MLSRRRFLLHSSAAPACTVGSHAYPSFVSETLFGAAEPAQVSASVADQWKSFGRANVRRLGDSLVVSDGFLMHQQTLGGDGEFTFDARAPQGTEQVQIWATIRCRDRESRYVFGLRGGDNDDLYLARYAPDGESKFLGVAPLDFHPVPGAWYKLRAVALSNRLMIFVNENQSPLIDIVDSDPLWSDGSVSLGGGWLPVEFRDVQVRSLTQGERPCFRKNECTKAEQHGERTASRSPAR
jgi:hypothetical protein